jgi:hypothetical protein
MSVKGILERYQQEIEGVLGCFDRVVVAGTLKEVAHPAAMEAILYGAKIRFFELGKYCEPIREQLRDNALRLAKEAGVEFEYLSSGKGVNKEQLVAKVLAKRGMAPGLVHVLALPEACTCYKPYREKGSAKVGLRLAGGKCTTYYFYLIDAQLGLLYVRVPSWLPCRLQIYFNAHHWLAARLQEASIDFQMADNAFKRISNWELAQQLASDFSVKGLEEKLHHLARRFCPMVERFAQGYHWSLMQVEYALDIVFRKRELLSPLYEEISRQALLAVRVSDMARFWGKRLSPEAEAQSDFKTFREGTRIKHRLGLQWIKIYDKGRVLRIEATSNDITFFRHHREVVARDGHREYKQAALKKTIYSLPLVMEFLGAACRRYLHFVAALEDHTPGRHDIDQISRTVRDKKQRTWRGFNLFLKEDQRLLLAILRGEFTLHGLSNRRLGALLPTKSSSQIGRLLRRLRVHRLIRRVPRTYRYYLTRLGQRLLITARKLFEHVILPNLQAQQA